MEETIHEEREKMEITRTDRLTKTKQRIRFVRGRKWIHRWTNCPKRYNFEQTCHRNISQMQIIMGNENCFCNYLRAYVSNRFVLLVI